MNNLKTAKLKIRVTPEQSEHIQKICFEDGIEWGTHEDTIIHTGMKYLFIDGKYVTYGTTVKTFRKQVNTEITYSDFVKKYGEKEELPHGARWVMVKDGCIGGWEKRFLIKTVSLKCINRFCCVFEGQEEIYLEGGKYSQENWEQMKEIEEPTRVPYTVKSLPQDTVWVRLAVDPFERNAVVSVEKDLVRHGSSTNFAQFKDVDKWFIANNELDENGNLIWKSFYQTK